MMRIGLVFLLAIMVSGCVPAAVVGLGALTTTAIVEERGVSGTISDSAIRSGVNAVWLKNRAHLVTHLSISVREGRVLLTGRVATSEDAVEAIRLTWTVSGVTEVIDRIQVGQSDGLGSYLSDGWITTKIKTAFLTDSEIYSINYTVKTCDGVVYIMGIAQTQKELDRVVQQARETRGVSKVVTYVRVKENDVKIQKGQSRTQASQSVAGTDESGEINSQGALPTSSSDGGENDFDPVTLGPVPDKPTVRG